MWSPCEKTCGIGRSARKRTCRDDTRADIPKEEKTCKGIERQTRACDAGSCNVVEKVETAGDDPTGMVKGDMKQGLKESKKSEQQGTGNGNGNNGRRERDGGSDGRNGRGNGNGEGRRRHKRRHRKRRHEL